MNDPTQPELQAAQPAATERPDVGAVDVVKRVCECADCRAGVEAKPYPLVMRCPSCRLQHVDQGEWGKRPHKTHRCVDWTEVTETRDTEGNVTSSSSQLHHGCGFEWTPGLVHTVGVKELKK